MPPTHSPDPGLVATPTIKGSLFNGESDSSAGRNPKLAYSTTIPIRDLASSCIDVKVRLSICVFYRQYFAVVERALEGQNPVATASFGDFLAICVSVPSKLLAVSRNKKVELHVSA